MSVIILRQRKKMVMGEKERKKIHWCVLKLSFLMVSRPPVEAAFSIQSMQFCLMLFL